MKKLIAVLLMVTMLASLSVCAFAADSSSSTTDKTKVESPTQQGSSSSGSSGGDTPAPGAPADEDKDKTEEPTQEVTTTAAPTAEDVTATDEEGNEVAAGVGSEVPEDAAEETKAAVEELGEQKEAASDALTVDAINDAIADTDAAGKLDGKNAVATEPVEVYSPENKYPMRVTLPLDDVETFVTALIFENGAWAVPDAMEVDEEAATVSFTINGPVLMTVVYAGEDVAAA